MKRPKSTTSSCAGRACTQRAAALGTLAADEFCVASGAWTGTLAGRLGCRLEIKPIRGQIALLQTEPGRLRHVVNEGILYLVPRADGRILVGSTEEDTGFDKRPTAEAIAGLLDFAVLKLHRRWPPPGSSALGPACGPGSLDGLPYLGAIPDLDNAFVAAGHFRSGLQLSTATAVVIGQLIRGQEVDIDLTTFSPTRTQNPAPRLQPTS